MTLFLIPYALVVLALVFFKLRDHRPAQYFLKPLAALGFIAIALGSGALDSIYGLWVLAGLVGCAFGDVFLLSKKNPLFFKLGMAAFALGHVFYAVAFFANSIEKSYFVALPLAVLVGVFFLSWLWKNLSKSMRVLVTVYIVIIMTMVVASSSMPVTASGIWVLVPAVVFAVSDMFVARDRFVKADRINTLIISPLYFGAEALFALSTSSQTIL